MSIGNKQLNMEFRNWLTNELKSRQWSQSDLAKAARISRASVSIILSGQHKPGHAICEAIAKAFNIPPEMVYRKAGLIPLSVSDDQSISEIKNIYSKLDDHNKGELLEQARLRLKIQEEKGRYKP